MNLPATLAADVVLCGGHRLQSQKPHRVTVERQRGEQAVKTVLYCKREYGPDSGQVLRRWRRRLGAPRLTGIELVYRLVLLARGRSAAGAVSRGAACLGPDPEAGSRPGCGFISPPPWGCSTAAGLAVGDLLPADVPDSRARQIPPQALGGGCVKAPPLQPQAGGLVFRWPGCWAVTSGELWFHIQECTCS